MVDEGATARRAQGAVNVHLDRLPRTVRFLRAGAGASGGCDGSGDLAFPLPQLVLLNQTKLPYEETYRATSDWHEAVDAIKTLEVRGAPAIGIAGAAAVALAASELALACRCADGLSELEASLRARVCARDAQAGDVAGFMCGLEARAAVIAQARPTAVNLAWAVDRALAAARAAACGCAEDALPAAVAAALCDLVEQLLEEDEACNRAIGDAGAQLLAPASRVLTHCNAGSLATAFYGTALGVVYAAAEQGKIERVYADETRPVGQGARLTTWELARAGVPVTLVCDDMAASVMRAGLVDAVIVGADRIAANGDVANKIGTYGVAVLARHHGIPFYVAAPSSTIDFTIASGAEIPIEQRDAAEVLPRSIEGVDVLNPAFDVTPADLVTRIITERGSFAPADLARAYGVN